MLVDVRFCTYTLLNNESVNKLTLDVDEFKLNMFFAGPYKHCPKIPVIPEPTFRGYIRYGPYALAPYAVYEVRDAVFFKPLVVVVVSGNYRICAPLGKRPLHM